MDKRISGREFFFPPGSDFNNGAEIWRLSGNGDIPVPAPVVDHDLNFLTREQGEVFVLEAGPEFRVLATSEPGKSRMATPSLRVDGLLVGTRHHLIAVRASP